MKVLVCGGRAYPDLNRVYAELDRLRLGGMTAVITGACPTGADRHASAWCQKEAFPLILVPPHWAALGTRAGPVRNRWMLDHCGPHMVLAFPGGAGTENMVSQARQRGVIVEEVK